MVGSECTLIDGCLRFKAAQRLGLATVPVVLADELSDEQLRTFDSMAATGAAAFHDLLRAACAQLLIRDGSVYSAMSSSELDILQCASGAAGGRWSPLVISAKHTFPMGARTSNASSSGPVRGARDRRDVCSWISRSALYCPRS